MHWYIPSFSKTNIKILYKLYNLLFSWHIPLLIRSTIDYHQILLGALSGVYPTIAVFKSSTPKYFQFNGPAWCIPPCILLEGIPDNPCTWIRKNWNNVPKREPTSAKLNPWTLLFPENYWIGHKLYGKCRKMHTNSRMSKTGDNTSLKSEKN